MKLSGRRLAMSPPEIAPGFWIMPPGPKLRPGPTLHGGSGGGPHEPPPPPPPPPPAKFVAKLYCPAVVAAAVTLPAPSWKAPASMRMKYVVDRVRSDVGLISMRRPPPSAVTLAAGSVKVSTGVAQPGSPVQSLIVLVATVDTASLNASWMLRDGSNVLMPFGGSDWFGWKTGGVVSGLAWKYQFVVALDVRIGDVFPAKSANAPASAST